MHRTACVNLFSFSLQLLLQAQKEWIDFPVAVVSNENASGRVLELNKHAKQFGLKKNDSYVTALSMCPVLKAQVVGREQIEQHQDALVSLFRRFSPVVESASEAGVFWLDCSGILRLYASELHWATAVRDAVLENGFFSGICTGTSKFGTYAVAKSIRGLRVLDTVELEQQVVFQTPLLHLDVLPKELALLARLGVSTLGELLALPGDSLKSRFSKSLYKLHQVASAARFNPIVPQKEIVPVRSSCQLDGVQSNALGLLFIMKNLLTPLLTDLAQQRKVLHELNVAFVLDHAPNVVIDILPAVPSLKMELWLELLRLKLERVKLNAGVTEVTLEAKAKPATLGQLALFQNEHHRDLEAANRALARLRARFGEHCVQRASLADGHLPVAQYQFLPMKAFAFPAPGKKEGTLVRRIYEKPIFLNSRPVKGPAGIHFGGLGGVAVKEMNGPYVLEGGWWINDICREYYFAKTQNELLWVYFDRLRRQWFLQGQVE